MSVEFRSQQLLIGEWLVEPALDQISRADRIVKLEPRTMRLLLRLAEHPGQVVKSQQLLDDVWPGVVVGPASLYQAISQLRKLLDDVDTAPTYIANVPRKGYRLIAPTRTVEAASVLTESSPCPAPAHAANRDSPADASEPVNSSQCENAPTYLRRRRSDDARERQTIAPSSLTRNLRMRSIWMTALALLAAFAAIGALYRSDARRAELANSIVVLPFVDLTSGQRDAAFCDGLTEELSTTLSHLPGLRVVARTSAYAFRNKPMDVREIGRKLSVTHVLEGSVRRSGDAVRVTARLVDTQRGYRRWSESWDLPAREVFGLQRDIAHSVAAALQIGLSPETSTRMAAGKSHNAEAYELYLQARHHYRQRTPEANSKAIDLNERAAELDENFALAYVGAAQARLSETALIQRPVHELSNEVERLLDAALRLDPELSDAYATRGALRREQNRLVEAREDLRRAIGLNPSNVTAVIHLGRVFEHEGLPRQALRQFIRARLLDPLDFMRHVECCITLQELGQFENASRECERARTLQPDSEWGYKATSWLAFAQGRLAEALQWTDQALEIAPGHLDLYIQRAELLRELNLPEQAQRTLDNVPALVGDNPHLRYPHADMLLLAQSPQAVREAVAQFPLDGSLGAGDWLNAVQVSLSVGDVVTARAAAAHAHAAPDIGDLHLRQYSNATWGFSYRLPLAAIEFASGRRELGSRRMTQLLQMLDAMEHNGYASWGVESLRADVYGLLGESDEAMAALDRAMRHGWRGAWAARRSPYLDSLSGREDFQGLMRRVDELNTIERAQYDAERSDLSSG